MTVLERKIKSLTESEIKTIRKVQGILQSIEDGDPKFFNIQKYEQLGLVTSRRKWGIDSSGNRVVIDWTYHLTPRAKAYLEVVI